MKRLAILLVVMFSMLPLYSCDPKLVSTNLPIACGIHYDIEPTERVYAGYEYLLENHEEAYWYALTAFMCRPILQ